MDAILGALSLPDIGQLFPDNDPNWRGADSSIFMEEVTTYHELINLIVLIMRTSSPMYDAGLQNWLVGRKRFSYYDVNGYMNYDPF